METGVCDLVAQDAVSGPSFDETTFDEDYFTKVSNYQGRYEFYNPPRKIAAYLREIRRTRPSGSLLDVGCAFGRFLEEARRYYACEGLDISGYALRLARRRLPDVPLHHQAIQTFRPGRTYDVVTGFDVLEHIPDLDAALAALRGLLAPGGILVLALPVYDTLPGRLFGLIDRDPTHVHRLGRRQWLRRLQDAGLVPIVYKGILRAPLPGYFVHVVSPLFWVCSQAILLICVRAEDAGRPAGGV
ncbi:MAG: class I SAM-dependent methyltransferase [Armatimonadota bacterium]|nr:class I SAM-dependent methyltransferase [Armatimonadota bacterium]MDR7519424.1 class I SAM-dependent methyltransferase [Armatimonadota bacterium]MDR7549862.1 class I SAM-dependent methyltransferase [Armatimonadota bacterium]